jgi:uncharacterized protein YutD
MPPVRAIILLDNPIESLQINSCFLHRSYNARVTWLKEHHSKIKSLLTVACNFCCPYCILQAL